MDNKELINHIGGKDFDKNHANFRELTYINFMENIEQKFINNFRFEGDEDFTLAKQRIMLKQAFRFGIGGVISTPAIAKSKLDEGQEDGLKNIGVDIADLVREQFDDCIPVGIAPSQFDMTDRIVTGTGFTSPRHNIGRKTWRINKDDTAMVILNHNLQSGWFRFLPMAYMFATGRTIVKKRLTLQDTKMANNKVNNSQRNVRYEDVYDVDKSFLELAPSHKSVTNNKDGAAIDLSKMLDLKLAKIDFNSGESVNDLIDFIVQDMNCWNHLEGVRTNTNIKKERVNSDEMKTEEVHFAIMENEFKDQAELFIEDYKRIFGKELTLKILSEKVMDEMKEENIAKATGGANLGDKPEDKGDKDDKA